MEGAYGLCSSQGEARGSRRSKHSRFVVSDEMWERQHTNIYQIYIEQNNTLSQTMDLMKNKHNFRAGKRKYKMKLKEWGIEKYLSATDMRTILAKAAIRTREEEKETIFYNGGQEISVEKIENFKKRMAFDTTGILYHDAATPTNVTYHTPHPEFDGDSGDAVHNDSASHLNFASFPDWFASTVVEDQLGTEEDDYIELEVSSLAEDDDLESLTDRGNEVSTDEISVLPCGHKRQKSIAEAFEKSLSGPIRSEVIAALKNLSGLQDNDESLGSLPRNGESHGRVEVGLFGKHRISSSKILRKIFDVSIILESDSLILASQLLKCERLRSLEERLSCHGCIQDYITSFRSVLGRCEQFHQWQEAFLAMAVLRSLYLELQAWDNLKSTLKEMHKLLDDIFERDDYLLSDILVEGLELANTYSILKDFVSAHSVFSCVLPKLWLLNEMKYEADIIYGYAVFGLHYKCQGLWREAFEYLSLAHKGLMKSDGRDKAEFLKWHLEEVSGLMRMTTETETDRRHRKELDHIEMSQANMLLKNIVHGKMWEAVMEDKNESEESEMDMASNRYGLTYSVTSVTGISDSIFTES